MPRQNSLYLEPATDRMSVINNLRWTTKISKQVHNIRSLPNSVPANLGDMSCGVTATPELPSAFRLIAIIIQKSAWLNVVDLLISIMNSAPPHMDTDCNKKKNTVLLDFLKVLGSLKFCVSQSFFRFPSSAFTPRLVGKSTVLLSVDNRVGYGGSFSEIKTTKRGTSIEWFHPHLHPSLGCKKSLVTGYKQSNARPFEEATSRLVLIMNNELNRPFPSCLLPPLSMLCVKTSLCAKPFIWKCVPPTGSFSRKSNSFS